MEFRTDRVESCQALCPIKMNNLKLQNPEGVLKQTWRGENGEE